MLCLDGISGHPRGWIGHVPEMGVSLQAKSHLEIVFRSHA